MPIVKPIIEPTKTADDAVVSERADELGSAQPGFLQDACEKLGDGEL